MSQENINVVARLRPFSKHISINGESSVEIDAMNSTVTIKSTNKKFKMNNVFDENATQEAIYNNVGEPVVGAFLDGFNGTIFAYGQTGSGKTFTMLGPDEAHDETKSGIIPRAVENIFAVLNAEAKKNPDSFSWSLKCSFLEIYNETLTDLLQNNGAAIKIQSCREHITVSGAAEFEVRTAEECMNHLWRGWDQRKVAETSMNRESSRSHAVFMLTLITERTDGAVVNSRSSRLNLVDLAGSERQGQTNNTGEQLKEAGNINKSLSILARIIRSLSTAKEGAYISYRDSLLTHLLRDSLGGNAKTTVIVNIHPNAEFIGDTGSTLTFAINCKKVKNTAHVNVAISCKDVESLKKLVEKNEHLLKENEKLQEDLAEQKEINVLEKNQREAADNEFAKMKNEYELIIKNIMDELNKEKLEKVHIEKERDEADAAQKRENLSQNCTNLREKMMEDFNSDISSVSVLSNAQRKQRRQTQFVSRPVQPPSYAELEQKLDETEKALNQEERVRSESELEVNRLNQIVAEMDERIRELENEKVEMVYQKYEMEKERNNAMQELAENNGHQNHAQKIQHVQKMKNEIIALKDENTQLKSFIKAKGLRVPENGKENKIPTLNYRW